jgi:hypothetical protein
VPVVAELLSSERLALSRDQYGATPLHKVRPDQNIFETRSEGKPTCRRHRTTLKIRFPGASYRWPETRRLHLPSLSVIIILL